MSEKQKRKREQLRIRGYVTIWQGEGEDKKIIVKRTKNHFVDAGLKGLVSALIGSYFKVHPTYHVHAWMGTVKMYLGSDTIAVTTHGMTALTSPIGTAPGTPPDTISGADRTNPATGTWKTSMTFVWHTGTISGTVGELALYLRPFDRYTVAWELTAHEAGVFPEAMVSRLSNADTDFSSFVIDPTKSLTVQWELEVAFS